MLELLISLVVVYIYGSFSEYIAHRWLMHKSIKPVGWAYSDHMVHHSTYSRTTFFEGRGDKRDFSNLIICLEHTLIFTIPIVLFMWKMFPVFSITLLIFSALHHVVYNKIHSSIHLQHDIPWWIPGWFYEICLRNHFLHHLYPNKFFCVSLPGADYLMGTTVLMSIKDYNLWGRERSRHLDKKSDAKNLKLANGCSFRPFSLLWESGYLPPSPTKLGIWLGRTASKLVSFLLIGKIKVIGSIPNRTIIIASNHSSWKDVFVFPQLVSRRLRIMAHPGVIGFCKGIFASFLTSCMGFVPMSGPEAVDSAVRILGKDESVAICPEGYAWMTGELHDFKTGCVRISQQSEIDIVPISIRYGSYPGPWILKYPPWAQYVLSILTFKHYTGATVTIGDPIYPSGAVKQETARLHDIVRDL